MASRGFLIRFIDIGLIVLFGFLMISDIDALSRVELAAATELEDASDPRPDVAALAVDIEADGSFRIGSPAGATPVYDSLNSTEALEAALDALRAYRRQEGMETLVVIRPSLYAPVQRMVDAMDVADRLRLKRSLQLELPDGDPEDRP